MRDIAMFLIVFAGLPLMLWRPSIGAFYWVWLGMMNPHRLAFGPAHDFPFAVLVAGATILGMFLTRDERRWKPAAEINILLLLLVWMGVTTLMALAPDAAAVQWQRVMKVQVMTFVILMVLNTRRDVEILIWVLALSIGFYAVKGGLFTLATGGNYRVWGPEGSYVEDNNAIALASVMTIPLFYHLYTQSRRRWVRHAFVAAMVLSAISVLGSHSRGALLAIGSMTLVLWMRSRNKFVFGLALVLVAPTIVLMMPEQWSSRMGTIAQYEEDGSAMGRIHTWTMLWRIAAERLTGAGFEPYEQQIFDQYIPEFPEVHAAHSIYFQVLGEHGWIGFTLFILMWLFFWRTGSAVLRATRGREGWEWAHSAASMIQVSIVGYLVGGAFLNMAYWDMPYYEIVAMVLMRDLVRRQIEQPGRAPAATPRGPAPPADQAAGQAADLGAPTSVATVSGSVPSRPPGAGRGRVPASTSGSAVRGKSSGGRFPVDADSR